jgi:Uma2 family endonuclease
MTTQTLPVASPEIMTFEEFLSAYDGVHAEWVDGKAHLVSPGNTPQSRLTRFLASVIQTWAEEKNLGEAFVPPLTVRLLEGSAREPDVFFVRREHLDRVHGTYVDGPPDLVVEIISRDSRGLDRGQKFYEYEQGGVPEYWLIDPERRKVESYRLGHDATYEPTGLGEPTALRADALPGLWIPTEWLWQEPLPRVTEVQKAWGLI